MCWERLLKIGECPDESRDCARQGSQEKQPGKILASLNWDDWQPRSLIESQYVQQVVKHDQARQLHIQKNVCPQGGTESTDGWLDQQTCDFQRCEANI